MARTTFLHIADLQMQWERAVKEQKNKKGEAANTKTAAQRMKDIHDRVKMKEHGESSGSGEQACSEGTAAAEKAKFAAHIDI